MISSLDGATSVGGKASPLGSPVDRQTMRNLRAKAGAVMVGAGTLRAEKLTLGLDDPPRGRQPLAVVVTSGGDIPLGNLAIGEDQQLLVLTTRSAEVPRLPNRARLRALSSNRGGALDVREALRALKAEHGVEVLLVEGGPGINNSLLSENLADELFLTIAPKLVGGTSKRTILQGPTTIATALEPLSVHQASAELFCRYRLAIVL